MFRNQNFKKQKAKKPKKNIYIFIIGFRTSVLGIYLNLIKFATNEIRGLIEK